MIDVVGRANAGKPTMTVDTSDGMGHSTYRVFGKFRRPLTRTRVAPFDDRQVALVESFADQAVIAIENSRLFEAEQESKRGLARSVEELQSLGKVSQAVNSSLEVDKVLPTHSRTCLCHVVCGRRHGVCVRQDNH